MSKSDILHQICHSLQRTNRDIDRNLLLRIKSSLLGQGLRPTAHKFLSLIQDARFDIKYGTETCAWIKLDDLAIESNNRSRGRRYQPTTVKLLRKIFDKTKSMTPVDPVLVDLGCGKGRVLLIAAESGFSKAKGVEFAHELCQIAMNNCDAYKSKTGVSTDFSIVESDVVNYAIKADENVFYMGNPFDEVIVSKVLDNIAASLKEYPRKILIIYYNPECGYAVERQGIFAKLREYSFWGPKFAKFTVYSN